MSKSEQIRQYLVQHPEASAAEIAKKLKAKVSHIYVVRSEMKKQRRSQPKFGGVNIDAVHDKKKTTIESLSQMVSVEPMKPIAVDTDMVNKPPHYTDGGIETIDFIESKRLGYHLGNVIKYISRAGKKGTNSGLEDLRKAQWYLARAIEKNEINVSR